MKPVLKTNDLVELSWAEAVLSQAGIDSVVFDTHTAIVEGSIGAIPRRLLVSDEDFSRARRSLENARAALDASDPDA
ncbi:MAG TPA: DUF2007 domain-containing protein [Alphaproteobacteria bacterium]|nr:DUF2007 domain-containing protein [Alphaproteobacteria bacterium]